MIVRLVATFIVSAVLVQPASAQQFQPGYLDPAPVLRAARNAIGTDNLKCITISGGGFSYAVGQARINGYNIDWPRIEALTNYTRTFNWDTKTLREEFDRKPRLNPASWRWGLGWVDGDPIQKNTRQIFMANGANGVYGWHMDGADSAPVAARPEEAERWLLDMYLNPHGFLKAAQLPGANPVATWRWELGEQGRDGIETVPEKVTVVSITILGKYRVDATIDSNNILQRIHTWVGDPVLGDMNYEHEFSPIVRRNPANTFSVSEPVDSNIDVGNGVKWPTYWHHHEGWDDNFQAQNVNAGHNAYGGEMKDVKVNVCPDPVNVPAAVRQKDWTERVETTRLGEGVYLLGGGPANSVAIEFRDFIAVIEAPLNEKRSLAVIEEVTKLIPNKPIRFLVNTHQHHDHIGGIRTYRHIGATIVTQELNLPFYKRDVINFAPRTISPDLTSLMPPTELAEGYGWEGFSQNYVISDNNRNLNLYWVQPLDHADGMTMAYLPRERMLIQANLFDTHEPPPAVPTDTHVALHNMVQRLKLDVATIVPIHGKPVPWSDFMKVINAPRPAANRPN